MEAAALAGGPLDSEWETWYDKIQSGNRNLAGFGMDSRFLPDGETVEESAVF